MIASHLSGAEVLPPLFTDAAYKRSGGGGNYRLSTSNVGYTPMCGGFAPMTADGYGVCYALLEGRMNISVSAWRACDATDALRFKHGIAQALVDLRALCVATEAESK